MTEPIKLDRTCLCSVLFVDIVQYTLQSLEIQTEWKRRFNQHLAEALKEAPEPDRVILDTGDGAAICFLGDPAAAMFSALRLVGAVTAEKNAPVSLRVRIGINLGSIKLVKDINGNPNAVGDGINISQRIMAFAKDNQILVSRSFFEVASSLSESYAGLFRYEGVRKDKHVREHTLYELHPPAALRHGSPSSETAPLPAALTAQQMARLENELALIIGPISQHLVRRACRRAVSPAELREALLAFVPSGVNQEQFLKVCDDIFSLKTGLTPETAALGPAILETAGKDLAAYIGPMARMLVDRAAARASTKATLYEMLSREIPSAPDREAFLKKGQLP